MDEAEARGVCWLVGWLIRRRVLGKAVCCGVAGVVCCVTRFDGLSGGWSWGADWLPQSDPVKSDDDG
jgi:hypothetical protein